MRAIELHREDWRSAHAPFLHAIIDHPDDQSRKLVYADWLEENALHPWHQMRMRMIRGEVDMAVTSEEAFNYLLSPHDKYFTSGGFRAVVYDGKRHLVYGTEVRQGDLPCVVIVNGFIEEVNAECMQWESMGGNLCCNHPINKLTIIDKSPSCVRHKKRCNGVKYAWFKFTPDEEQPARHWHSILPEHFMPGEPGKRAVRFKSWEEATEAFHSKALAWGRKLAARLQKATENYDGSAPA